VFLDCRGERLLDDRCGFAARFGGGCRFGRLERLDGHRTGLAFLGRPAAFGLVAAFRASLLQIDALRFFHGGRVRALAEPLAYGGDLPG